MNIIEKFNQDKETTIQFSISELLHFGFSDFILNELRKWETPNVNKLLSFFPLQKEHKYSDIKKILKELKNDIPSVLFDDVEDEIRDIWDDYKWANSKDGKEVLKIEEWIKEARRLCADVFPNKYIYIGRTFITIVR